MTPEEQRIKIAEACGWRFTEDTYIQYYGKFRWVVTSPDGKSWACDRTTGLEDREYWSKEEACASRCPNYLNDLNAMHKAERMLTTENAFKYSLTLGEVCMIPRSFPNSTNWHYYWRQLHATAAQRSEAFLKTLNLWTE